MSPGKEVESKGLKILCYFMCSYWVCSMIQERNLLILCADARNSKSLVLHNSFYGTATEWNNKDS